MQIVRVRDVMIKEVLSIDGMASARDAARMMREHRVSELLVDKRNEDDAWGIVTIMDLIRDVVIPGKDAQHVFVYEIMTKPIITVPADMDIRYAIRLIQRVGVQRAPVEESGHLVGMLSLASIVLDNDIL